MFQTYLIYSYIILSIINSLSFFRFTFFKIYLIGHLKISLYSATWCHTIMSHRIGWSHYEAHKFIGPLMNTTIKEMLKDYSSFSLSRSHHGPKFIFPQVKAPPWWGNLYLIELHMHARLCKYFYLYVF